MEYSHTLPNDAYGNLAADRSPTAPEVLLL